MPNRSLYLLILAAGVASGCTQQTPTTPTVSTPTVEDVKTPKMEEITARWKHEFAVVYLILPRGEPGKDNDAIADEMKRLLDEPTNTRLELTGSGYLRRVYLAPVKDVEALGLKQTLGRVLACDPAKRTLLIERGADSSPREAWKGETYLDREVMARKARWGLDEAAGALSRTHPKDQVVCIRIRGKELRDGEIRPKLTTFLDGPMDARTIHSMQLVDGELIAAVAPVKDLKAFAAKIDFAKVVFLDEAQQVIILELPGTDRSDLKKE